MATKRDQASVAERATATGPVFAGFGPKALDFFRALDFHQDKTWFESNRVLYETDVKAPLEALVLAVTQACGRGGLPLQGNVRSLFRLHRDVRFAKDKRPYKTNGGAILSVDGTKKAPGLLYIHVDPKGCFVAAGFWHPEPPQLQALRQAIVRDPQGFRAILARLDTAGLALGDGDPLARLPKGYDAVTEPEIAAAVKMRNLIVRRPLPDALMRSPDLVTAIVTFAADAAPLLRFGWDAIGLRTSP